MMFCCEMLQRKKESVRDEKIGDNISVGVWDFKDRVNFIVLVDKNKNFKGMLLLYMWVNQIKFVFYLLVLYRVLD